MIDGNVLATGAAGDTGRATVEEYIGKRVREDVLREKRAEYGEKIVQALSAQLTAEYGRGFGRRSLFRMMQFAEQFADQRIVSALSTQLSWSHVVEILPLKDPLRRDFCAELCRVERWNVRTLRHKIDLKLERFQAADKGQMELYLRWLEKHETRTGEEPPLGPIS